MNFSEALNLNADDIKRPPMLPVGNYQWTVKKQPNFGSAGADWETCEFICNPVSALSGVDPDLLEQFNASGGDMTKIDVRKSFMFPKDADRKRDFDQAMFQLKEFLSIDLGIPSASLKEMLANAQNRQFIGALSHRPDKDNPDLKYHEIRKTAPLG